MFGVHASRRYSLQRRLSKSTSISVLPQHFTGDLQESEKRFFLLGDFAEWQSEAILQLLSQCGKRLHQPPGNGKLLPCRLSAQALRTRETAVRHKIEGRLKKVADRQIFRRNTFDSPLTSQGTGEKAEIRAEPATIRMSDSLSNEFP